MPATTSWVLMAIVLVAGVIAGGWATLRFARTRFDGQVKRLTEEMTQRHGAMADQLRAAQTRTQTELEKSRSAFKRQLDAVAAEPRAALQRSEERLKAAYAELDRLRGGTAVPVRALTDGFAATEPMQKGM